jgi:hypothetical protein
MRAICEDIKQHVSEVLLEWEELVREQPWFSLPADHRIDSLPDVVVGLVEAALCNPFDEAAHRRKVEAAAEHGFHRREQEIPESLIFTEYHLLRLAIWRYLGRRHPPSDRINQAMLRIDGAITVATNASLWGYHRTEIEALGKWEEGVARITSSAPMLSRRGPGSPGAVDGE